LNVYVALAVAVTIASCSFSYKLSEERNGLCTRLKDLYPFELSGSCVLPNIRVRIYWKPPQPL